MKDVQLKISGKNTEELKVAWPWGTYTVNRQAVETFADDMRKLLAELVEHYLKKKPGDPAGILKRLAEKGNDLYRVLFIRVGDPDREDDAEKVRADFEALADFRLDLTVTSFILVPWGLVYSKDPRNLPDSWDGIPDAERCKLYDGFWCFAHNAIAKYKRKDTVRDASALAMLRVVHPAVFDKALQIVKPEPENGFIEWLENQYGKPKSSANELFTSWETDGAKTGILYFYCHASATKLAIGTKESIDAAKLFVKLYDPKRNSPECLLFVNGCRTAVGAPNGSFLMTASTEGICGFIGTEADVPDVFALRFSTALLHLMFKQGRSLGEAIHELYHAHFPLSLVYAVWAHRDFRMAQPGVPDIVWAKPQNFSDGTIGTRTLEAPHAG